ncbi:MAG: MmcQ/YjbR family DNA-binding protein [Candidatus Cloacimonetes bacterium]|nr:MmcQ/YjbR family DNA-binding protein [Candidatus Cloacimonadota bacterium]
MTGEEIRKYCLKKPGSWEDLPFDPDTLVIKIGSKMFALISPETDAKISLKCEPLYSLALREKYPSVTPGYYLNKKHWNTIVLDGSIPMDKIKELIDLSYELVFANLAAREKLAINETVKTENTD